MHLDPLQGIGFKLTAWDIALNQCVHLLIVFFEVGSIKSSVVTSFNVTFFEPPFWLLWTIADLEVAGKGCPQDVYSTNVTFNLLVLSYVIM